MARETSLLAPGPNSVVPAEVTIVHPQLRDLAVCPHERGVVNYVQDQWIVEHDVICDAAPRRLSDLGFKANSIASYPLPDLDGYLLAAGGQDAELHLAMVSLCEPPDEPGPSSPRRPSRARDHRQARLTWRHDRRLPGSINNALLLTSVGLAQSNESAVEPRLAVSNNDCTVQFYDVSVRRPARGDTDDPERLQPCGVLGLDVPVNHSSVSPDGRTVLSVGDSAQVHLHQMSGGAQLTFTETLTLTLPLSDQSPSYGSLWGPTKPASFSTAFSASGSKFAVGAQDGMVVVWDVRSTKPLKVFNTDRGEGERLMAGLEGNDEATGWIGDDWTVVQMAYASRGRGWGVRTVKFGAAASGREVMSFTEHTSALHVVDARTFETEEIVRMPIPPGRALPPLPMNTTSAGLRTRSASPDRQTPSTSAEHPSLATRRVMAPHRTAYWYYPGVESAPTEVPSEVDPLMAADAASLAWSAPEGGSVQDQEVISRRRRAADQEEEAAVAWAVAHSALPRNLRADLGLASTVRLGRRPARLERDADPDIAGTCFDPSGGHIYLVSTTGVAEWSIRGAEKRWWVDDGSQTAWA